eukprot:2788423-Amphidinium_carterae.1
MDVLLLLVPFPVLQDSHGGGPPPNPGTHASGQPHQEEFGGKVKLTKHQQQSCPVSNLRESTLQNWLWLRSTALNTWGVPSRLESSSLTWYLPEWPLHAASSSESSLVPPLSGRLQTR